MNSKIKTFYYVEAEGNSIGFTYSKSNLAGPSPLIWNNAGLYGIICKEKIENMTGLLDDQTNLPVLNPNLLVGHFYWDETEKLDPRVAKLLLGE